MLPLPPRRYRGYMLGYDCEPQKSQSVNSNEGFIGGLHTSGVASRRSREEAQVICVRSAGAGRQRNLARRTAPCQRQPNIPASNPLEIKEVDEAGL